MEPYETIYVGDSEEDIVGANNANLISMLIDRNSLGYDWGQHYTVNTLQDILRIVLDG
jgi:phosphoglycolate phosphatase-like HAD superfamily hydrolase